MTFTGTLGSQPLPTMTDTISGSATLTLATSVTGVTTAAVYNGGTLALSNTTPTNSVGGWCCSAAAR